MKKILVIGGNGFMGKNIQHVFASDAGLSVKYESRSTGLDLTDYSSVLSKLKSLQPEIIIHAAAHVGSIGYVNKYAATVVHDNTLMYINLYKALLESGISARVINPISNCSYPGIIDVQNEEEWWNGKVHESVESYGNPKKMGFIISECYRKQHGINTTNLIMPNAYGPDDYIDENRTHAMNGIIMRMIRAQKAGDGEFVVWGTGSPVREWIYMPDMAVLIKSIIHNHHFDLPNPINIGQESGISILESVELVKRMLDYDVKIVTDTSKPDGAPIKVVGNSLFRKHFPDFRFTGYQEGITQTIRYYKQHIS